MTALAEIKALAKSVQAPPREAKADPLAKLVPILQAQAAAMNALAEAVGNISAPDYSRSLNAIAMAAGQKGQTVTVQAPPVSVNPNISVDMGDLTKAVRECTTVLKQFLAVASAEKRIVFEGGKPVGVRVGNGV